MTPCRSFARRAAAALVAAAGVALLLSCTGVGDGGTGGTDDFLNRGAELEPASAFPGPPYVHLVRASGDRDSVCIGVEVLGAQDVFAAAFTLTYDATILQPTSFDAVAAACLGSGGQVLPAQVDWDTTPGRIVVGLTRNAAASSNGVTCGHLIDLCFDVVGEGSFQMRFVDNLALLQFDGTTVLGIDASKFVGATVEAHQ